MDFEKRASPTWSWLSVLISQGVLSSVEVLRDLAISDIAQNGLEFSNRWCHLTHFVWAYPDKDFLQSNNCVEKFGL